MSKIVENTDIIEPVIEMALAQEIQEIPAEKNLARIDAYTQGTEAFMNGSPLKANPHDEKKIQYEWRKGWLDARESYENPKKFTSLYDEIQNEFDKEEIEY